MTENILEGFKLPETQYNRELYDYFNSLPAERKKYSVCELEVLGEGAAGTTYSAKMKQGTYQEQIVLKEQEKTCFCLNEHEALKLLRKNMMEGKLPGYFIFLYDCFNSGKKKYFVLEKADKSLDEYLTENNLETKEYLEIFYHLANAVSFLEAIKFNHGDLWTDNVMLSWQPDQEDIPESQRKFNLKIIDFDSAFMENSQINSPSYGGADKYRKKFILGYDLSRYFDSILYSYESYLKKKLEHKKKKINRLKKLKKKGKNVVIPSLDESDESDREFDEFNIIYPQPIIDFIYSLKPNDPNYFKDCERMSGKSVMQKILDFAAQQNIDLFV